MRNLKIFVEVFGGVFYKCTLFFSFPPPQNWVLKKENNVFKNYRIKKMSQKWWIQMDKFGI